MVTADMDRARNKMAANTRLTHYDVAAFIWAETEIPTAPYGGRHGAYFIGRYPDPSTREGIDASGNAITYLPLSRIYDKYNAWWTNHARLLVDLIDWLEDERDQREARAAAYGEIDAAGNPVRPGVEAVAAVKRRIERLTREEAAERQHSAT